MLTVLLDAAAWPFYAMGYMFGYVMRVFRFVALAVQIGFEEGNGNVTNDL